MDSESKFGMSGERSFTFLVSNDFWFRKVATGPRIRLSISHGWAANVDQESPALKGRTWSQQEEVIELYLKPHSNSIASFTSHPPSMHMHLHPPYTHNHTPGDRSI